MIKAINLEIIDICNLKCKMCDIWQNKTPSYLSEKEIENIFVSRFIDNNTDISLTGGEIFLHPNIKNIFLKIKDLGFRVNTISTNGTLNEKLFELLDFLEENNIELPNIHISIDGLEEKHDAQRGIKGSFNKTLETLVKLINLKNGEHREGLKKGFFRPSKLNIKIKFTITKTNIEDIEKTYLLAKKLGVEISFKIVENDENYTNKKSIPELLNEEEKDLVYQKLFKIYSNKNNYINNLLFYIKNKKLDFRCTTPKETLFIKANGEIFPCTKYESIGNVKHENIDNIIGNKIHEEIIFQVEKINCSKCFSLHGSYKSII